MNLQKINVSLSVKSLADREFDGHGSVFKNVDYGNDVVMPGAFKQSLRDHAKAGSLPQMFWMHDPSRVPGKWLDMSEDSKGLAVKGVLADTDLGNEIHTLLKMDAVRGLSIGYQTKEAEFDSEGTRLIKEAELWEVSIVSLPMNPLAQVAHVKSRMSAEGAYVPTPREFESEFRRMGCSKRVSRQLISMIFSGETPEDLDEKDEKDETGGTLVESKVPDRCDADAEKNVLAAMQELNESLIADRIKRMAQSWRKTA